MAGHRVSLLFLSASFLVSLLLSVFPHGGLAAMEGGSSLKGGHPVETADVKRFYRWLEKNGMQRSKLELAQLTNATEGGDSEEGREEQFGVVAPKGFKGLDVVATIPPQLWVINVDLEEEFGVDWKGKAPHVLSLTYYMEEDGWEAPFAVWLMREKARGESSFYYPWIKLLPKSVPLPLLFSDEEVRELQYTPMIKSTRETQDQVKEAQSRLEAIGMITPSMSRASSYAWAVSIVYSRTIRLSVDAKDVGGAWGKNEAKEVTLFAPFLDMFNVNFEPQAEVMMTRGKLSIIGTAKVSPGAQIHLHHGVQSCDYSLSNFGFIPPYNPYENAFLFSSADEIAKWYAKNLGRNRVEGIVYTKADALKPINNVFDALIAILPEETKQLAKQTENRILFGLADGRFGPNTIAALAACSLSHAYLSVGVNNVSDDEYHFLAATAYNMALPRDATTCKDVPEVYRSLFEFAMYTIHKLSVQKLARYPTTIEEDLRLLACVEGTADQSESNGSCPRDPPLSANVQLAIRYRLEKKKIYASAAQRAFELCGEGWGSEDTTDVSSEDSRDTDRELGTATESEDSPSSNDF